MNKTVVFETVLKANRDYVRSIEEKRSAEVQEIYLNHCMVLVKNLIIDAGLAWEYAEYCEKNRR